MPRVDTMAAVPLVCPLLLIGNDDACRSYGPSLFVGKAPVFVIGASPSAGGLFRTIRDNQANWARRFGQVISVYAYGRGMHKRVKNV